MSLSWLWALLARVGTALWDRWQSLQQAIARGRAEEQNRARQEAEKAEAKGEKAAEEAAKTPVDEPDEFMRRD